MVCSARHELVDRHAEWSESHRDRLIILEPLSDDDSGRMIDELLGNSGLDQAIVARVVAAAEGNPLFVEQMVSMLVDNGTLRRDGDRWVAIGSFGGLRRAADDPRPSGGPPRRPGRGRAGGRRTRLRRRPGLRRGCRGASHRRPAPAGPCRSTCGCSMRKQFVRPDRLDEEDAYRFGHQLIRDTAYGSLLKRERVVLHRAVRRLGRRGQPATRSRDRVRGDPRLPPRAGLPVPHRARTARRRRRAVGRAGVDRDSRRPVDARSGAATSPRQRTCSNVPRASSTTRTPDDPDCSWEPARPTWRSVSSPGPTISSSRPGPRPPATASDRSPRRLSCCACSSACAPRLATSIDDVMRQTLAAIDDLEESDDADALARAWRLLELAHGISGQYRAAGEANTKATEYARQAGDHVLEMRLYASAALVAPNGPDARRRWHRPVRGATADRRARSPRAGHDARRAGPPPGHARGLRTSAR